VQAQNSVLEILDTKNITYSLTAPGIASCLLATSKGETCFVESVLLHDTHGRVQVLIPSGYIVDLDAIYRQFDRDFDGVPEQQIKDLVQAQELSSLPAIPKWQGLQTLIDSRLLKNNKIWLKSGHPDQINEINQVDFQSMIDAANVGEIAVEEPELDVDPSSVESRKTRAVLLFSQRRIEQRLARHLEAELEQPFEAVPEVAAAAEQRRGAGDHDGRHSKLAGARYFAALARFVEALRARLLCAVLLRGVVIGHGRIVRPPATRPSSGESSR